LKVWLGVDYVISRYASNQEEIVPFVLICFLHAFINRYLISPRSETTFRLHLNPSYTGNNFSF